MIRRTDRLLEFRPLAACMPATGLSFSEAWPSTSSVLTCGDTGIIQREKPASHELHYDHK